MVCIFGDRFPLMGQTLSLETCPESYSVDMFPGSILPGGGSSTHY